MESDSVTDQNTLTQFDRGEVPEMLHPQDKLLICRSFTLSMRKEFEDGTTCTQSLGRSVKRVSVPGRRR